MEASGFPPIDADSGVTHSLKTSTARLHDSQVWDALLHGGETSVWADKDYVSTERGAAFNGPGKVWGVMRKPPKDRVPGRGVAGHEDRRHFRCVPA